MLKLLSRLFLYKFILIQSLFAMEGKNADISPLKDSNFNKLCIEMTTMVFQQLPPNDLLNMRKVCSTFKSVTDEQFFKLPQEEAKLLEMIEQTHMYIIPKEFKIPKGLTGKETSLELGQRLFALARVHYCSIYKYYSPEDRLASARNLDRYRMLMYVSYNLGVQEASSRVEHAYYNMKDELEDFPIHLVQCSPQVPDIEPIIYAFWWEQIASFNSLERPALALAYRRDQEEGNKILRCIDRATHWEGYQCEYDFPIDFWAGK